MQNPIPIINDDVFLQSAAQDGHDIRLMNPLANSPYLNGLDLGLLVLFNPNNRRSHLTWLMNLLMLL